MQIYGSSQGVVDSAQREVPARLPRLDRQLHIIAWLLLPLSVLLIVHLTLLPYDFQFGPVWSAADPLTLWRSFLNGESDPLDVINNYVLFMPLGFSIARLLSRRGPWPLGLLTALGAGAALSLSVELLQLFLPSRTSTVIDVRSNTLGSGLGWATWLLAALWFSSRRTLIFGLSVYLTLALLAALLVPIDSTLGNWDRSYGLHVGNEQSGNRLWQGDVTRLLIADQALSAEALLAMAEGGSPTAPSDTLLADYVPDERGSMVDRTGQQPALVPRGATGARSWLSTGTAAPLLNERIARSSQFTLVATVASAGADQFGPARIISLSDSTSTRNLTLGQQGSDLIIRLRNPMTGLNGTWPELEARDIFTTTEPRQLVVTYTGSALRLTVDGREYPTQLVFTRAWSLVRYIMPPEVFATLTSTLPFPGDLEIMLPSLICLMLIYVPAGLLLALIHADQTRGVGRLSWLMAGAGLLLAVFQGSWALAGGTISPLAELAAGIALLGAAFAWFRARRVGHVT